MSQVMGNTTSFMSSTHRKKKRTGYGRWFFAFCAPVVSNYITLIYEKYQKNQRHNKYHIKPLFQAPQSRAPSLKKVPIIRRV
jgi:hypothetical protein